MADVEKININSTDYDIADAKALRNKDTAGSNSFIDTRAGTTTYPTTEAHTDSLIIGKEAHVRGGSARAGLTVLGNGAYANMSYCTVIGDMAHSNGSQTVSIGYNASAGGNQATAIGNSSVANAVLGVAIGSGATINSGNYSILIGSGSGLTGQSSILLGYGASISADYSIAFGRGSTVGSNSSYSVAIGYGATASNNSGHSLALGYNARTTTSYATQIGEGTNSNYGSLQFRSWPLVNSSGKIPSERLNISTMDTAYPMNLYSLNEEERTYKGMFYTGQTCDALKQEVFYRSAVQYSHPRAECTYVSTDALQDNKHVIIDQEKFFLKCAEISKQRIDNSDQRNSFVGGDNSSQSFYFYYDKASEQWHIEFGSEGFEGIQTPDDVTGITPADFGIYCAGLNLDWMDADATEEIFDIEYYAPCYCDSYDYGDSGVFYINYMQLMQSMCDGDWGFGRVIDEIATWTYSADGTSYDMPEIPQSYVSKVDSNEYDYVEVRWEWVDDEGKWAQYINGNSIGYSWTTSAMESTFGITIESDEESNLGYIGITFRGAEQRYWAEALNKEDFPTKQSVTSLQAQVNYIDENKVLHLIQNQTAANLDNLTTGGVYHLTAGMSNGPTSVYQGQSNVDAYVIVANKGGHISQTLIVNNNHFVVGASDYSRYMPTIFVRNKVFDNWGYWSVYLTPDACGFINGFDFTKKQTLVHDASSQTMKWEDAE